MVAAEISKRLQEGWTLLNEHCPMPSCGTPLLKDHKKEIYCAKCRMYCISADKAKSLATSNGNASESEAAGDADAVPALAAAGAEEAKARQSQSRAAAEAAMGEKLLQGWTMLAQECPTAGCCVPLMRDRNRTTTCVACGGNGVAATATATATATASVKATRHEDVDCNSQFADPPAIPAPASTVSAPPSAAPTAHSNSAAEEEEQEPVMSEEEFAAVRKKRDTLSASLGRYMLQGWSLLDRMCPREGCEPGTPLLKNRSTGAFFCAGCDTRMREGEAGGLVVESTEAEASGSTAGLSLKRDSSGKRNRSVSLVGKGGAGSSVPAVPAKAKPMQVESEYEVAEKARFRKQAAKEQSSGSSGSATLAQRLLQGWAMLSITCPEPGCHNPLMRDRNGKEQCVSCSGGGGGKASTVSTPRREAAAGAEAASATAPVQAAGDFAGEMETEDEGDQALLDDEAGRAYAERRMEQLLAISAGGAAAGTERAVKSDVEGDAVNRSRIQSQALDTLYRSLDLSQQRLRACCPSLGSVDVDESIRQADLIAKLAVATRAVSELSSGSL